MRFRQQIHEKYFPINLIRLSIFLRFMSQCIGTLHIEFSHAIKIKFGLELIARFSIIVPVL